MARRFLIDKILPARQVHLIAGPSGVGKTRWTFGWIKDWLAGKDVLGFASHPEPIMYFATDRNRECLEDTMSDLGVAHIIPWDTLLDNSQNIEQVIQAHLDVKVFVFDPIMMFVPGYKFLEYGSVASFLRKLTHLCEKYDVTIIGIVHTTKVKENENFLNPRERLLGSAAWGAYSNTLFVLGSNFPDDPDQSQTRFVHVLPRNAAEFKVYWKFDEAGIPTIVDKPGAEEDLYALFISQIPHSVAISTAGLQKIAFDLSISRASFFRYLKKAVAECELRMVRHGFYQKDPPTAIQ